MADPGGMLQSFTIAKTLGFVPLPLLLAAVATAAVPTRTSSRFCAGAAWLSWGLSVFEIAELARLPPAQRYLFCHLAEGVRIGSLDASLALALDPLAAAPLLSVSTLGAAAIFFHAVSDRLRSPPPAALAAASVLLAATQTLLLASGFLLLLLSWSAAAIASFVLLGRRAVSAAAGIAAVLLVAALALLFWSYGGGWHGDGYIPELRPRMFAAQVAAAGDPGSAPGKAGQLSLRALAGTRIGLGGAELCAVDASGRPGGVGLSARPCREPAKSPFARLPVPHAIHDFRLSPGHGTFELLVEKVRIESGREVLLGVLGPTLDFRELGDQLSIGVPAGDKAVRRTLQRCEIFGLPALPLAVLLLLLAAATLVARVPRAWASALAEAPPAVAALVSGVSAVAGVYLLARLEFLVELTPAIAFVGAVIGCAIAIRCAARAFAEANPQRAALLVAVAHGGVAFGGVAAGAAQPGVQYLGLTSGAAAALALAVSGESVAPGRARWLISVALTAAPLPLLAAMLRQAAPQETTPSGVLIAVLLLAASGLISFTVWAGHYRAASGATKNQSSELAARAAGLLALLAIAGGLIAGYAEALQESRAALLASVAAGLGGWLAARRLSKKDASAPFLQWLSGAPKDHTLSNWAERGVDFAGAHLVRLEQFLYADRADAKTSAERPEAER